MKFYLKLTLLLALCCIFALRVDAISNYSENLSFTNGGTTFYQNPSDDFSGNTYCTWQVCSDDYPSIDNCRDISTSCANKSFALNHYFSDLLLNADIGECFWLSISNMYWDNSKSYYYPQFYKTGEDTYDFGCPLPSPSVFITTPESSSIITEMETELVGGWTNINSSIWKNIKLAFNDLQISETSGIVNIPIDADNGNFSIPLSSFNITNNGGWNLRSIIENDYEYNFDIPSVQYNLIFDIEGWQTPYAFTDFETWYSENVEDYEEPSTWAMNLTGSMNPIFEKIGQFGNRINDYLDVSTGYEKGLQIGSVFPVIGAYVLKIDLFFGGFPIVQFFKWGILIMVGLFAVKIILKLLAFIPFIGGGG